MKKKIFPLILLIFVLNLFSFQESFYLSVKNVEVPLRVYKNKYFVDNLSIEDFRVYEEGKEQKIESLYLIKKNEIVNVYGNTDFMPHLNKNYYLIFQIIDYNPKIKDVFEYMIKDVLLPGDTVTIQTPMKSYYIGSDVFIEREKEVMVEEIAKTIRKDTNLGSSNYRNLIKELKSIVRALSGSNTMSGMEMNTESDSFGVEFLLQRYKHTLQKLEELRLVDQETFLRFAANVKGRRGRKRVIYFYQREYKPEIPTQVLNHMVSNYQDKPNVLGDIQELFNFYNRGHKFDVDMLKKAFADSSIQFNFIFMNNPLENTSGINMKEQSEDYFSDMKQLAHSTSGFMNSSQNPVFGFKQIIEESEVYYLLYYTPLEYIKDGSFRNIDIKVDDKDLNLRHRIGYFTER